MSFIAVSVAAVLGAVSVDAKTLAEPWQYQCDGTDGELIAEIQQAFESGIGYGETWDATVCNQGLMVLGDGVRPPKPKPTPEQLAALQASAQLKADEATAKLAAQEAAKLSPSEQKRQDQYFAIFVPVFGFMAAMLAILLAAVIAVLLRLRKQVLVEVNCPACRTSIPFIVGESVHLFCPACGGACRVSVEMHGKTASAMAISL